MAVLALTKAEQIIRLTGFDAKHLCQDKVTEAILSRKKLEAD